MAVILNRIRNNKHGYQHQRLSEDKSRNFDPILEGVTFNVSYLGSCIVDKPSGEETTSEAVKTILKMAKKLNRKLNQVELTISLRGIKMVDCETRALHLDFSIYRVSYCMADPTLDRVFTFIATNSNTTMECHAFLCPKKKIAQSATMTIAQAFNLAFESWLSANERKRNRERNQANKGAKDCRLKRTDNSEHKVIDVKKNISDAIAKCEDIVEGLDSNMSKDRLMVAPPRLCSYIVDGSEAEGSNQKIGGESLLIDFSSWNKEKLQESKTDADRLEIIDMGQDDNMDLSFTQIAQRNTPIPILRNLPKNTSSLQLGSFICSNKHSSSPAAIPLHGSSLTTRQLSTPVGSPPSRQAEDKRLTFRKSNSQTRIVNNLWKDNLVDNSLDEKQK